MTFQPFNKIQFGDGLTVTDEGGGEIRVDAGGAGGSGIKFDTYPQAGQWLYIETDGAGTSPTGFGIEVLDTSGNGIDLVSENPGPNPGVHINSFGSGQVRIDGGDFIVAGQQVNIGSAAADETIITGGAQGLLLRATNPSHTAGKVAITSNPGSGPGGDLFAVFDNDMLTLCQNSAAGPFTTGTPILVIHAGPDPNPSLVFYDYTGNAIFQIDNDGTLHGLTGKSLVFDL